MAHNRKSKLLLIVVAFVYLLVLLYISVCMANNKKSKLGAAASARVKISRPHVVQSLLGQITQKNVTLHQHADGRLRQSFSHIPTGESILPLDHIDDFEDFDQNPVDPGVDPSEPFIEPSPENDKLGAANKKSPVSKIPLVKR